MNGTNLPETKCSNIPPMDSIKKPLSKQASAPNREPMEKQQSEVVLFGTRASPFFLRVELALKLKGITYEFVEEDLANKSDLLLQYNPVHKKVPVLVHKGKPICESLVILEYIDEYWNNAPKLLPEDPFERAKLRFWANFYDQKLLPPTFHIVFSRGKEQEKVIKEFSQLLTVFEKGIKKDFSTKFPSQGEILGFLDVVVGANACNFKAFEEVVAANVVDPEEHPIFISWVKALNDCPLMKETILPHDKQVEKFRERIRQLNPPKV